MVDLNEVIETNTMVSAENLDVRTITIGISLLDCMSGDLKDTCDAVYSKITRIARDLVAVGDEIALEIGIPVINKRISVTPVAIVGAPCCRSAGDFVEIARTLDRAAKAVGVNFIGGYSALIQKGMTDSDRLFLESIPEALSVTENLCCSV